MELYPNTFMWHMTIVDIEMIISGCVDYLMENAIYVQLTLILYFQLIAHTIGHP